MIAARSPGFPVSVLGRGRLGRALAAALEAAGARVALLPGREEACPSAARLEALREGAVLLAVPDDALEESARELASLRVPPAGPRYALHLAGALDSSVLRPLAAEGFETGSCHPLQSFPGTPEDAGRFAGCVLAIEGSAGALGAAEGLALLLGSRAVRVDPRRKVLYHAAASLAANGLTGLLGAAVDALAAAGFGRREALDALAPLLRTALAATLADGPESALTGPVARNDVRTLARHGEAVLAWDASRAALLHALVREQRRLAARKGSAPRPEC